MSGLTGVSGRRRRLERMSQRSRYLSRSGGLRRPAVLLMTVVVGIALAAAWTLRPAATPPGASANPTAAPSVTGTRHWNVVALGDSVTSGAQCECTPFPQVYAQDVSRARGIPTTAQNFGANGLTSGQLLAQLRDPSSSEARAVPNADIVLVTIGANDFSDHHDQVTAGSCTGDCLHDELSSMRSNVAAVLQRIHALRHGRPTAVLVTGYWNVFEDGEVARSSFPEPGVMATRELTLRANQEIRGAARACGATYVDLYRPFNGPASQGDITGLLASDGDHPDARGHQLIASALVAAGLPGLLGG